MTGKQKTPAAPPARRARTQRRSIALAPDILEDAAPAQQEPAPEAAPAAPRRRAPRRAASAPQTAGEPSAEEPAAEAATPTELFPARKADAGEPLPGSQEVMTSPDAKPGEAWPGEPVFKLTVNIPESLHARASGIVHFAESTGLPQDINSLTDLVRNGTADLVERIEKELNSGYAFPATRRLRRGRRSSR